MFFRNENKMKLRDSRRLVFTFSLYTRVQVHRTAYTIYSYIHVHYSTHYSLSYRVYAILQ